MGLRDKGELSARQRRMLQYIGDDLRKDEIALLMGISPRTVEGHRDAIRGKLGGRTLAHAVRIACERGILQPEAGALKDVVLTRRQADVLRTKADGLLDKEIGVRLGIAAGTVQIHMGLILAKLGARSAAGAIMPAFALGILQLPDAPEEHAAEKRAA